MIMFKNIFNDVNGFIKELILEPGLFYGPIILAVVYGSFYWILLYIVTIPILYNITDFKDHDNEK